MSFMNYDVYASFCSQPISVTPPAPGKAPSFYYDTTLMTNVKISDDASTSNIFWSTTSLVLIQNGGSSCVTGGTWSGTITFDCDPVGTTPAITNVGRGLQYSAGVCVMLVVRVMHVAVVKVGLRLFSVLFLSLSLFPNAFRPGPLRRPVHVR